MEDSNYSSIYHGHSIKWYTGTGYLNKEHCRMVNKLLLVELILKLGKWAMGILKIVLIIER